jgi:hypothetical protein
MSHVPEWVSLEGAKGVFLEYLDYTYQTIKDLDKQQTQKSLRARIDIGGRKISIKRLMGFLWFCTDPIPEDYCPIVDMPRGSTYAQVVRTIRPELEGSTLRYRAHFES